VNALAISSAGQLLVSSSWDKTIRLWTLPGGQEKAVLRGNQNEVRALAVSPAGQLLVSGSNDGTIQLWKLSGGQEQAVLYGHRGGIEALAVSADAQTLATGGSDQNIILWELWEMVHMLQVPLAHMDRTDFERIQGWKNDASLSPGQHAVACYVAAVLHYRLGENAP
jgi:WD40 repeat protein